MVDGQRGMQLGTVSWSMSWTKVEFDTDYGRWPIENKGRIMDGNQCLEKMDTTKTGTVWLH